MAKTKFPTPILGSTDMIKIQLGYSRYKHLPIREAAVYEIFDLLVADGCADIEAFGRGLPKQRRATAIRRAITARLYALGVRFGEDASGRTMRKTTTLPPRLVARLRAKWPALLDHAIGLERFR